MIIKMIMTAKKAKKKTEKSLRLKKKIMIKKEKR